MRRSSLAGGPQREREGTFAPLQYRNYRLLWLGQTSHAFALWMEQIARPFLVLDITDGSAAHLGGVLAVRTAPQLVFGVFAGVISDWFDRRLILLVTKISVLILSILFAALLVFNMLELWHIYAFQFLRGSMMAFDQPARQSMVASTVPERQMIGAVALLSSTQNVMRIVGTVLAGIMIETIGMTGTFVGVAVVYIGAVWSTYLLDVPTHERPKGTGANAMLGGLVEGAKFAWSSPPVRGVLLLSLIYFTFGMSYSQVFVPVFAEVVMDIGAGGGSLMIAATGVGALAGALIVANRQPVRVGLIMPLVVSTFGLMLVAFSLATYLPRPAGLILPFILIGLTGTSQTSFFSLSNATMLTASPPEMRGRVISLLSLDRAMMSLGGAVAGFMIELQGVQVAQVVFGAVCVVGGLAAFAFIRELRDVRIEPGTPLPTGRHGALPPAPSAPPEQPAAAEPRPARSV